MDGGQVCTIPQSSVLFDGVIPSLTGRNNNTRWASQLLVLDLGGTITFEFSPPGSGALNNITAFEIIMLNCPQELMGAPERVKLEFGSSVREVRFDQTSCDHLIRVCDSFSPITANTITLSHLVPLTDGYLPTGYYLTEVSFYNTRRSDCPSSNIVNISSSLTAPTRSLSTTSRVNTHFKGMSLGNQISLYSFVNVIVCTLVKAQESWIKFWCLVNISYYYLDNIMFKRPQYTIRRIPTIHISLISCDHLIKMCCSPSAMYFYYYNYYIIVLITSIPTTTAIDVMNYFCILFCIFYND